MIAVQEGCGDEESVRGLVELALARVAVQHRLVHRLQGGVQDGQGGLRGDVGDAGAAGACFSATLGRGGVARS